MVSFECSDEEYETASEIVSRAIAEELAKKKEYMDRLMDIIATHANGCPLDMKRFLDADEFNFAHDFLGIVRYIDRKTGKMKDHFVPRFHRAGE